MKVRFWVFGCGVFLIGTLVGGSVTLTIVRRERRIHKQESTSAEQERASESTSHSNASADDHSQVVQSLKAEIENLKEQVPRKKSAAQKRDIANEVYRTFSRQRHAKASSIDFLRAMELFVHMDNEAAAVFIEKYMQSLERNEVDSVALKLLLFCGGRDVADFLKERLHKSSPESSERAILYSYLGGAGSVLTTNREIPFDPELITLSFQLANSSRKEEREAGLGLLGAWKGRESREYLRGVILSEADQDTRITAIRALGLCGDMESLEFLVAKWNEVRASQRRGAGGALDEAFGAAIIDIQARHPSVNAK